MATVAEAKEYLNQVKKAVEVLQQCDIDLRELTTTSNSFIATYGEYIGGSNLQNDTSSFVSKKMELEKELEELKLNWLNKRIEVRRFILDLDIPTDKEYLRSLLLFKYVTLKSFEEISCILHYNYVYVVRDLHSQALKIVAENLKTSNNLS